MILLKLYSSGYDQYRLTYSIMLEDICDVPYEARKMTIDTNLHYYMQAISHNLIRYLPRLANTFND